MLSKLLVHGIVGPMHIGQSKIELLSILGPPSIWDGKPGTILDKGVHDYERSKSWVYNGIFVSFDEGLISEFNIWMAYPIDFTHAWFSDWSLPLLPKLSDVASYLELCGIPFEILFSTTKPSRFGCDLVLFESRIWGVAKLNPRLEEIDMHGITRFKDSDHVPLEADSLIDKSKLKPSTLRCGEVGMSGF